MVLRAADYLRSEVNQQTYSVLTPLPSVALAVRTM